MTTKFLILKIDTIEEFRRVMSSNMKVRASFLNIFGAKGSGSYESLSQEFLSTSSHAIYGYVTVSTKMQIYQSATLVPQEKISPGFANLVNNLPTTFSSSNAYSFQNLISSFGTHFIDTATLGGQLWFMSFMNASSYFTLQANRVNVAAGIK